VSEGAPSVTLHVLKSADSAQVPANISFQTRNGSAFADDYGGMSGTLNFTANETAKAITIAIAQDLYVESNHTFFVELSAPTLGTIAGPSEALVTIVDDDVASTNSVWARIAPSNLPPVLATLRVDLLPTNVGQWRFSWETAWHDGGVAIAGLLPGNYELEFKPVSGYVEPLATFVPVATNALNAYTFVYSNTTAPQLGSLSVGISPALVATNPNPAERGQWRRQGELAWHNGGEVIHALPRPGARRKRWAVARSTSLDRAARVSPRVVAAAWPWRGVDSVAHANARGFIGNRYERAAFDQQRVLPRRAAAVASGGWRDAPSCGCGTGALTFGFARTTSSPRGSARLLQRSDGLWQCPRSVFGTGW